jgi:hypothetical protein
MEEPLTKWNESQLLMMASTFINLKVDEHVFANLVKQMVMYGVYTEHVLAHIFKAGFEELLMRHEVCSVYVNMVKAIGKYSLACSELAYRRVVMFAIEDLGVRMLAARNEAQRRRMLKQLGPIEFQRLQKKDGMLDLHNKFSRFITDLEGYREYERFKSDCLILKRFVRELVEAGVLVQQDLVDIRAGFLGSVHSVSLVNVIDAEQKHLFFAGIASQKSTAATTTKTLNFATGAAEVKVKLPDLVTTSQEDAAWGGDDGVDKVESSWTTYNKHVKVTRQLRAATHGISDFTNKCESMLSPSTRNIRNIGGEIAREHTQRAVLNNQPSRKFN